MTALIRSDTFMSEVHANWGMWVAICGLGCCGTILQRFQPHFECVECGTVTEVVWPSEQMVQGVERLLKMRPAPKNRNWFPHETLHDLIWENAEHGLLDPGYLGVNPSPGEQLFIVEDNHIRLDNLPVIKPRIRKAISR